MIERFAYISYDWLLLLFALSVIMKTENLSKGEKDAMRRLFDEHHLRETLLLDGAWRYLTDPADVGETEHWYEGLEQGERVHVPSLWNNELGMLDYMGAAWYEKRFFFTGGTMRLCFDAVMTAADVWLDGVHLGSHYGGFTAFDFLLRDVSRGEHLLVVRADNRMDAQSIPQKRVDWYPYGGIAREVYAERLEGICILSNQLHYTLSDDLSSVTAYAVTELYNADEKSCESTLSVRVGERTLFAGKITLRAGERRTVTTPCAEWNDIKLWRCEDPVLYPLSATTDTDDLFDRVGFRKIEAKENRILLNGEAIELRGVNRHEEHPEWGFAFPQRLMKRDVDLLFDLHCNTVRGSHYPNSKVFVDMLDERGMLFWSEIPIWGGGFSEAALGDPVVVERGLQMHREMVEQYYNHPSIIIWGMHNEIKTETQNAYEMTKCYATYLRANGGNRLITHATDHPAVDICLEFDDIICINMYYGWYDKENGGATTWVDFMEMFRRRRASLGMEQVPVVFSEFGAAALYGCRDAFNATRWSEEYQADLLSYCLELFHADPMVSGFYIWQMCNIRTSPEAGLTRARTFNNKGILDEYRNPKLAYFTVKDLYMRYQKEETEHENDHNQ